MCQKVFLFIHDPRVTSCALLFFGADQKIYDLFISGCYGSLCSPYIIEKNEKSRKVKISELTTVYIVSLSPRLALFHSNICFVSDLCEDKRKSASIKVCN